MNLQNVKLTKKDFDNLNWQEVLTTCEKKRCPKYSSKFFAKAQEAAKNSDDVTREVYALLGNATLLRFDYKSKSEPFGPEINQENSLIRLIETFSDNNLSIFDELLKSGISDSEMKARIADILWVRKRNHEAAKIAIEAYLLSAANLEHPEHWSACYRRIERALRIAAMLGKEQKTFQDTLEYIKKVLNRQNGEDPLYFSNKLMLLLFEHKIDGVSKYTKLSQKLAKRAEKRKDWEIARTHWETNSRWHARQGDSESERKALVRVAELFVEQAKMSVSKMGASTFQQKAVEAFRQIGGMGEEVEKQHKILLKYQKDSLREMGPISTPFSLPEEAKERIKSVRDKTFREALFELCLIHTPQNVGQLRKEVKDQLNESPLQFLCAGVVVNERGNVTGQHTSMWSGDPVQIENAYREHMLRNAQFGQAFATQMIEPARQEINMQHSARIEDFLFFNFQ